MRFNKRLVIRSLLTFIIAAAFLVGTGFVPRRGNYVVNGTTYGDSAYRDVRGVPFVFVKRSLADGECDVHDVQLRICDPNQGNEPHQILVGWLVLDASLWILLAAVLTTLVLRPMGNKAL